MPGDRCTWVIAVEVADVWVADGFDWPALQRHVEDQMLTYARPGEVKVGLLKAPPRERVRQLQGYSDTVCEDDDGA